MTLFLIPERLETLSINSNKNKEFRYENEAKDLLFSYTLIYAFTNNRVDDKKEFLKVQRLARDIEKNSDALLVIGIGGSYLGAKAGIDMLCKNSKTEVI